MTDQTMELALEVFARLVNQEEVRYQKDSEKLYRAYFENLEVYDLVNRLAGALNLKIYDHKGGLYVTAGDGNQIFGFTNEELRKEFGVTVNSELYLCYFVIYNIIIKFYTDSATYTYQDYVKIPEIADSVDTAFLRVSEQIQTIALTDVEDFSFKQIALIWGDNALTPKETTPLIRSGRGTKTGFVKKVFNFLEKQMLFVEVDARYYPTKRFQALIEHYFEEHQSRIYDIMMGGGTDGLY